jgi:hypothetical protein
LRMRAVRPSTAFEAIAPRIVDPGPTSTPIVPPAARPTPTIAARWAGTGNSAPPPLLESDIHAYLAAQGISTLDLREKGGSFWVHAPNGGTVAAELRRRGLVWSERRGAWYVKTA